MALWHLPSNGIKENLKSFAYIHHIKEGWSHKVNAETQTMTIRVFIFFKILTLIFKVKIIFVIYIHNLSQRNE